jgi:hypothetical protein
MSLLSLSEINYTNMKNKEDEYNLVDLLSLNENLNYLDEYIDQINNETKKKKKVNNQLINNNNTLKKRLRQNNINIASKKSRLRKQKKMNLMNDHINKLHLLILNENINYQSLLDEISNFNNNIIII